MSTLKAALSLAAKGCPVFPIHPGTKMPAIMGWPEQSTIEEITIRKWWVKWPDANVGIHTKGLLVFDIDGPVGEDQFRRLRQQYEIPETIRIDSGNLAESHHYQLLFRLSPGLRSWNKPLKKFMGFEALEKIDVKTNRGQVLGPGSVHHTGGIYRWAIEPASVPEETTLAPDWMLAHLCRPVATEAAGRAEVGSDEELLAVITSRFTITGHGQRSNQAASVVGYLVGKGIDQERVLRLASNWVRSFAGRYRTPVEIAEKEMCNLVYRTFKNLQNGSFELMPNHQQRTAEQHLPPAVADWFHKFSHAPISPAQTEQPGQQSTKHVLCSTRSRLSGTESNFVYCLLLHCLYELSTKGFHKKILMTDRQLISIHKKVFGKDLVWDTLIRNKSKFVTRYRDDGTVQKATSKELLVLEESGQYGRASVYRLTGLFDAFQELRHTATPEVHERVASQPKKLGQTRS